MTHHEAAGETTTSWRVGDEAQVPDVCRVDLTAKAFDIVYLPLGASAFGGAERSLLELASAQQAAGRRVLVCFEPALGGADFLAQAKARSLPLHALDWSPETGFFQVLTAAFAFFRRLDTSIVHFNISWRRHMWLVPVIARMVSSAYLLGTMRAMPDAVSKVPRRRYARLLPGPRLWLLVDRSRDQWSGRIWAATLHRAVSVNGYNYPPRLIREFGFPASKMAVVYNGVSIPTDAVTAAQRASEKRALGYGPDTFLIAYVGRLSAEKGILHAIQALRECDPRIHLIVAGQGPDLQSLEELAETLGVSHRVRFVGYVSESFSIFSAADAAVVPSLWDEAFGRVVVEAMACSTPVIATAVGGMQELFDDGAEGWFVPKGDSSAIARRLNHMAANPAEVGRMAAAARCLAVSRYATRRVAAEYSDLYAAALPRDSD